VRVFRLEPSAAIHSVSPSIHEVATNGCPESKDSFPRIYAQPASSTRGIEGRELSDQSPGGRVNRLLPVSAQVHEALTRRVSGDYRPVRAGFPTDKRARSGRPKPM